MVALIRYITKAWHLGPRKSVQVLENKIRGKIAETYWRHKALHKKVHHTWKMIALKHRITTSFGDFFASLKKKPFPVDILFGAVSQPDIIDMAHNIVAKKISVLGSQEHIYVRMPWHSDIRLQHQNAHTRCDFPQDQFYKDIQICVGRSQEAFDKDIKVPWELSRCQHFSILGQAYKQTGDRVYVRAFVEQITDWIGQNPYMLGVNWVCPMEVGLRALNWIIALPYFLDDATLDEAFWQMCIESLYDHMHYLENNWEIYDGRTSNHYLSDLVGYLYLTVFFDAVPGVRAKREWCLAEIVRECDKQVFAEGTSYEGSTAYHRLVTELFVYAYAVAWHEHMVIPNTFKQKISRMLTFIDWCTSNPAAYVTIGDNDSGQVTHGGITTAMRSFFGIHEEVSGSTTYTQFGVSIIKTDQWHITLRHHSYQRHQPSGHFHNDVGSITVACHGTPFIVDPGSFVYTPSAVWRNYFRSVRVHNGVFLEGVEPVALDEHLFRLLLPLSPKNNGELFGRKEGVCAVTTGIMLGGAMWRRVINVSEDAKILSISDEVQANIFPYPQAQRLRWNFTLDAQITPQQKDGIWGLYRSDELIARMWSHDLDLVCIPGWVSYEYGKKQPTFMMRGRLPDNRDLSAPLRTTVYIQTR